jgi:RHS repeat-associated protein
MLLRFSGPNTADLADRYLWAPVVDLLLSDENLSGPSTPGDIYWTLGDNLNTIRDIARYNPANDTTTIVNHRVFDAFGNVTSETNAAVDLVFAFTGRLFDEATGLQNNLHRWYDPTIGRWLSEDPIGFKGGDHNLYRYVKNAPTVATDPTGLVKLITVDQDPEHPNSPTNTAHSAVVVENILVRGGRGTRATLVLSWEGKRGPRNGWNVYEYQTYISRIRQYGYWITDLPALNDQSIYDFVLPAASGGYSFTTNNCAQNACAALEAGGLAPQRPTPSVPWRLRETVESAMQVGSTHFPPGNPSGGGTRRR